MRLLMKKSDGSVTDVGVEKWSVSDIIKYLQAKLKTDVDTI